MKRVSLYLTVILLLTAFLAGCGAPTAKVPTETAAPSSAPVETTAAAELPTEEPAEETTEPAVMAPVETTGYAGEISSEYVDEAYAQVIGRYYTALTEQWDEVTCLDHDLSGSSSFYYEGDPLENVGFGFVDLDNDGHCELVIGAILNAEQDASVFEIWTLVDDEPVMLAQGGSRNHYVLQYVEEDKMWYVAHEGSNSAYNFATYYLMLSEGKLEVVQGIVFNAAADEENPWFMSYDLDWDASNDEPIDEATANAILESQRKFYAALELIPYSSITP